MAASHWHKLGLIFCPNHNFPWMKSHGANPLAYHLYDDYYKIFFNCRDENQRSSVANVVINLDEPNKILDISKNPILEPGQIGAFDDSGVSLGCLVKATEKTYLYYVGWNLGVTVRWRNSIGLAINNGYQESFSRFSIAPILDRSEVDPFSLSYPWIIKRKDYWQMWYGSNLQWGINERDMQHVIKYAESNDGINWSRKGHISIPLKSKHEYAIARPSVLYENGIYKMWYSYRNDFTSYRVGYAESLDGLSWQRSDESAGIDISTSGWDSEMIGYATVFKHKEKYYMLYCGNGYGATGFGMAVLVE